MNYFELIIFDCDGVLVDSERIATRVFSKVIEEECGLTLSQEYLLETFMGQSSEQCLAILENLLGKKPPPDLASRYQHEIKEALKNSVSAIDGVEDALKNLSIPYCVASAGSHEKMQTTLGKTNLLKYFGNNIFSTSDVARGKPFPDVFLYAAKNMNCLNLNRCLVIEDSPLGVEGAAAAGMVVFGHADLIKEKTLIDSGAHHIIKTMQNLTNEINYYIQNKTSL